ncbi:MAG: EamA family transporter [Acidobacteria bacterium]|nr:EamA family transporter [Acidobacteriota bacterium]
MILYLAVFGTIFPYLLFMHALKHLSASQTGIISTLEPVAAAVIAWILLHENLTRLQLSGGLCVLLAIVILQKSSSKAELQTAGGPPQKSRLPCARPLATSKVLKRVVERFGD